jgi:RNA polymerase sigma-70 factor (ECF subfamily)
MNSGRDQSRAERSEDPEEGTVSAMSLAAEITTDLPNGHAGGPSPDNCADLEALHREFYQRLVRVCTQQLHDRSLAEDVAQDTILRALRFWGSYDVERPTWPWLKTIALRLCVDARRARSHEVCLDALPERPEPTDRTERLLDEMTVRRAMAGLPERQRLALRLRYFDDRDRDASAAVLGVNVNAFDQLLNRARMRLAHVIEPARAGALGVLLLPLRWLRRRAPRQLRGGGLATTAMGAMTTVPLAVAPLLAVVAGMTPAPAGAAYPAAHAFTVTSTARSVASDLRAALKTRAHARVRNASTPRQTVSVATSAGPAVARASVSKHPLSPGRVESYRVNVETPLGTTTVGGSTDRNPTYNTLCDLPFVDCS